MQLNAPRRTLAPAFPQRIRWSTICWMVGSTALTLGGCVSQQTYDSARHEAKSRASELAQIQADINGLEQQRDDTHAANQRDERTLANLKTEMKKIQASYDQIHKTNQAKLAALQQTIASLRARHQAMLKEISETKRNEKRLEAISAQREKTMATTPSGPEVLVMPAEGSPHEPRMVAVITPQSREEEITPTSAIAASAQSQAPTTPATSATTASITPEPAPPVALAASPSTPPTVAQAPVAPKTTNTGKPPAPQSDSWFSSMTGWLTSLFDWLWA